MAADRQVVVLMPPSFLPCTLSPHPTHLHSASFPTSLVPYQSVSSCPHPVHTHLHTHLRRIRFMSTSASASLLPCTSIIAWRLWLSSVTGWSLPSSVCLILSALSSSGRTSSYTERGPGARVVSGPVLEYRISTR